MRCRRSPTRPARRAGLAALAGWLSSLALVGCTAPGIEPFPEEAADRPEVIEILGVPAAPSETPHDLTFVIPPRAGQPEVAYALPTRVIYLNRYGGTFSPGYENSSTNQSSIPYYTSSIAPWGISGSDWTGIVDCVRSQFAAFNVEVTDSDPGAAPHIEAVVAGYPQDVQLPSGVGGASPYAADCSMIDRSIVYVFAEVWGSDHREICEVIAHEVGHSVGLDHEYLCADAMSRLQGCGDKQFQNANAYCGEYAPSACYCSATQNSVEILTERLGPADLLAPTVAIVSPHDGDVVAPGFAVQVDASDDVGLAQVELYLDGILIDTALSGPFQFATEPTLADGTHVLETRAYDSKNVASASIAVTVEREEDPPDTEEPPEDPGDPDPPGTPGPTGPGDQGTPDLWQGCAAGGTPAGSSIPLLLFLLFGLRRRGKSVCR